MLSFILKKNQTEIGCSMGNLVSTSLPLILSILSIVLMHVIDRVMLAHYSSTAMNAAGLAHQAYDIFVLPLLSFASISEVFVGQFNGSKQLKNTAFPVIQISIFLIACWIVIAPISLHFSHKFIAASLFEDGYPYFMISILTIPFNIVFSSTSAFFVGTRRPYVILYSVVIANILNFFLDWIFIFGYKNIIPAMGTKGAALASLISTACSVLIMVFFFFSNYNAKVYGSRTFSLSTDILKKNIILGAPYAISELIEMSIWVYVLNLLALVSIDAVTIQNVCVTLWIFSCFITDGFQKGIVALASNCIGANKIHLIKKLINSMVKLTILFCILLFIPLVIFPEKLLSIVFNIRDASIMHDFKIALFLLWIVLTLLMLSSSCFAGILSSGGDTIFVTYVKLFVICFVIAIPVFYIYQVGGLDALTTWKLSCLQQAIHCVFFYLRYKSGKWNHNLIAK